MRTYTAAQLKAKGVYALRWYHANKDRRREQLNTARWARLGHPTPTRLRPEVCESCGKPCSKKLAADHDHATGKFRGWLCSRCNTGIGLLGDTLESVEAARAYLLRP